MGPAGGGPPRRVHGDHTGDDTATPAPAPHRDREAEAGGRRWGAGVVVDGRGGRPADDVGGDRDPRGHRAAEVAAVVPGVKVAAAPMTPAVVAHVEVSDVNMAAMVAPAVVSKVGVPATMVANVDVAASMVSSSMVSSAMVPTSMVNGCNLGIRSPVVRWWVVEEAIMMGVVMGSCMVQGSRHAARMMSRSKVLNRR